MKKKHHKLNYNVQEHYIKSTVYPVALGLMAPEGQ